MVLRRAAAIVACIWLAGAATEPSAFEAYAVTVQSSSLQVPVALNDAKSRQYADELQSAAGQDTNFAGHFILSIWGCGASCVMGAAIDTKTGTVAWLPFTVCCWPRDVAAPLEFKADSRLLVYGSRNEEGSGRHAYLFDGHSFMLVPGKDGAAPR